MKSPVLVFLLLALAAPAWPQSATSLRVFISPSGEPFRPADLGRDGFDAWFDRVDADHKGRIDRAQFRADAAAFFKTLDVNGDGVIDGFEVSRYETTVAPELSASTEAHAVSSSREAPVMLLADPEPVSSADVNLDSKITLAGWLQTADQRFDLLDRKRQGFLDRQSLIALLPKADKPRSGSRR